MHGRHTFLLSLILIIAAASKIMLWTQLGRPLAVASTVFCLVCATMLVWAWALVRAPELVKSATALSIIGFIVFSLLACGIVRQRERARMNSAMDNLRMQGMQLHQQFDLRPGTSGDWQLNPEFSNVDALTSFERYR